MIDPAKDPEVENAVFVDIVHYDGPLDLLNRLVERSRIPIDRVSIVSIADQYLAVIENSRIFDMELASSFLLMAATLIEMKSRLLLPGEREKTPEEIVDAGDLLILRLLQYRRCRVIAASLKNRNEQFSGTYLKPRAIASREGVVRERDDAPLDRGLFEAAVSRVSERNRARFHSDDEKIAKTLERERLTLQDRMMYIAFRIADRARVFFYELFPPRLAPAERITGFLALLELVFQNRVRVFQRKRFDPILIERKERT